jgi:dipeptidyl-peptidase-4
MKWITCLILVLGLATASAKEFFDPVIKEMEGFTVHVDPALLEDDEGARILKMLDAHLLKIAVIMPADRLAKLRTCPIWIEKRHVALGAMQFHPSVGWLKGKGYDPRLDKMVHIPRASALVSAGQMRKHPWVILHELAHAYHKRILGHDYVGIREAYDSAKEAGIYEEVLSHTGRRVRHYGMNNIYEYFAESTEAYFAQNDFYPFVRAELKQHDPRMFAVMEDVWGKL